MSPTHSREARQEEEVSNWNLWTRQWRAERISDARADFRQREAAYACLKDKTTDYALSLKRVRDVCAQVLAVWESSPSDLTGGEEATEFELHCGDEFAASASGSRARAWAEIQHYAAQYQQDGPLTAYEVTRKPVDLTLARSFAGEDRDYPLQRAVDERGERR